MHVAVTLETVLHVGNLKRFYLYEFTELNSCLLALMGQLVPTT